MEHITNTINNEKLWNIVRITKFDIDKGIEQILLENGADRLDDYRVATNHQFVLKEITIYKEKCNKKVMLVSPKCS